MPWRTSLPVDVYKRQEVERRLGKKLSANDLRSLYTLYDHLALPAEVVLMLVRCV